MSKKPRTDGPASAFLAGLIMGIASPALLLCPFSNGRTDTNVARSLAGDWQRVGADMRTAISRVRKETAGKQAA